MLETVEQRQLLSSVTNLLMSNHQSFISSVRNRAASPNASAAAGGQVAFTPSRSSIALPENQGVQGTNLLLQPEGEMSPSEFRRTQYQATFVGPYTIGPGRYASEALQVSVRGAGRTTDMLHADIQVGAIIARDPSVQNSGASVIFDRNLNSNSALGFNLASPSTDVDSQGRPNRFVGVSLDANSSSGSYVEGFSQGVMEIRYVPSGRRTPAGFEQGTAYVKFKGQVYAPRVAFILRNSNINP